MKELSKNYSPDISRKINLQVIGCFVIGILGAYATYFFVEDVYNGVAWILKLIVK